MTAITSKFIPAITVALLVAAVGSPVMAKEAIATLTTKTTSAPLTVKGAVTPAPVNVTQAEPWEGANPNVKVNCSGRIAGTYSYNEGWISRGECRKKFTQRLEALQADGRAC